MKDGSPRAGERFEAGIGHQVQSFRHRTVSKWLCKALNTAGLRCSYWPQHFGHSLSCCCLGKYPDLFRLVSDTHKVGDVQILTVKKLIPGLLRTSFEDELQQFPSPVS